MRARDLFKDEEERNLSAPADYASAIKANMGNAMRQRKMRDGKLSVDALNGIVAEAKLWAKAYVKLASKHGKDIKGLASKLDAVIAEVDARHRPKCVLITKYKK